MNPSTLHPADYGIDAPPVVRNLICAGVAAVVAGLALNFVLSASQSVLASIFLSWGLLAGVSMLATAALMVWSSKVGKLRARTADRCACAARY
jgi:arsenite methyltransferase